MDGWADRQIYRQQAGRQTGTERRERVREDENTNKKRGEREKINTQEKNKYRGGCN